MSYDLKKENRKKFQDKTKLKRHHKKNYAKVVPKEPEQKEKEGDGTDNGETPTQGVGEDGQPLDIDGEPIATGVPTNIWRYENEVTVHGHDDVEDDEVNKIDFKKLYLNKEIDLPSKKLNDDEFIDSLPRGKPIGYKSTEKEYEWEDMKKETPKESVMPKRNPVRPKVEKPPSMTPAQLKKDEDFLDSLI